MKKTLVFVYTMLCLSATQAQTVRGNITDQSSKEVSEVNVFLKNSNELSSSNDKGMFSIDVYANRFQQLVFSKIGYKTIIIDLPMLKKGQVYNQNIKLSDLGIEIDNVEIEDELIRNSSFQSVDANLVTTLPSTSGSVEDLIKTLPGVSSSNELSSQYSVRGGNFDENLVYVNGIEVYRSLLIRSGQQEGLSFINSDLISSINFSSGGFAAQFGDKMSSVLDITYKKPTKTAGSATLSLLGFNSHIEGINKRKNFDYLIGIRTKRNQYLLNSLETKGEYNPRFADIQGYFNYLINEKLKMGLLVNYANNQFRQVPQNQVSRFGTISIPLQLNIYFEGQEVDQYETYFGAYNLSYEPQNNVKLDFIASSFQTYESETFDILSQYYISQVDNDLGSETFGEATFNIGVGSQLKHARNYLSAQVSNLQHKGLLVDNQFELRWGLKTQIEKIKDELSEWTLIDSSRFSLPHPSDDVGNTINSTPDFILDDAVRSSIQLQSYRHSGFIQMRNSINQFDLTAGTRFSYWDLNEEYLFSPRVSIAFHPIWDRDILFRFSTGIYYQTPFYRELRDFSGNINYDIESQKSVHFVLGTDYNFKIWQRPFKIVSELYYKDLSNLIPYEVDNVRIRYYAENNAEGYATGFDFRINGEFVKGIESWASLSLLKTEADILNDFYLDDNNNQLEIGSYARPTDQRVNFSLFFQDYLPKNPNFKMHLNLMYGSRLPLTAPDTYKGQFDFKLPDYKRVDIGFSAVLKKEGAKLKKYNPFKYTKSSWISLEVFNLLDIDNTISYLWVKDSSGLQFAVPNRLTSRLINLKLHLEF